MEYLLYFIPGMFILSWAIGYIVYGASGLINVFLVLAFIVFILQVFRVKNFNQLFYSADEKH